MPRRRSAQYAGDPSLVAAKVPALFRDIPTPSEEASASSLTRLGRLSGEGAAQALEEYQAYLEALEEQCWRLSGKGGPEECLEVSVFLGTSPRDWYRNAFATQGT